MDSIDVIVREAGLRDGLQIHPTFMPTENKIAWVDASIWSPAVRQSLNVR